MKAFHAYDIRGIYNQEFNRDDIYKIGFFLPSVLDAKKVLLGRDIRESSPEIFVYLSQGITDAGADVYDAGLTTTPMIYWATAKYNFHASVMITASHNDKEYNGLKVSKKNALPVGYDNGLKIIESKIQDHTPIKPAQIRGKVFPIKIMEDYLQFQKQYLTDLSNLNIAVDCSNGMAGLLIKQLLDSHIHYINDFPDGNFPGHAPNPLIPKNIVQLQKTVKKYKCDVGVIFDGDADRVMFLDEQGRFISPDLMIALLGHYFLEEKGMKGNVLQDIRTSKAVGEYIEKMGGTMHTWRVGRAYAALKLREINGIYGGELAGHYYFRDFYYSDSGIMACLIILGLLASFKKKGKQLSEIINTIGKYANSGEINFRIEAKKDAMEKLKDHFMSHEKATAFYDFDGYRIEFPDWWFNIRPSNTEPYLRLLVEASTVQQLNEKIKEMNRILDPLRLC
ncbi:MAG: phosphomannomutase/phosphoglucomutase [Bacteroidetes bacterium]|nr:phosphomannomutase/phosphoglucomutase [Bacteroidota bacterium]